MDKVKMLELVKLANSKLSSGSIVLDTVKELLTLAKIDNYTIIEIPVNYGNQVVILFTKDNQEYEIFFGIDNNGKCHHQLMKDEVIIDIDQLTETTMIFAYVNETLILPEDNYYYTEEDINKVTIVEFQKDFNPSNLPDNMYPIYDYECQSMEFSEFNSLEEAKAALLRSQNVSLFERYHDL